MARSRACAARAGGASARRECSSKMRVQNLAGNGHARRKNRTAVRLRDEERPAVGAVVGHVRHSRRLPRHLHAAERLADRTEEPDDSRPRVSGRQIAASSIARPSGPWMPGSCANTPIFATPPPGFSGQCHMQFARVIATNSTLSSGSSTTPFEETIERRAGMVRVDPARRRAPLPQLRRNRCHTSASMSGGVSKKAHANGLLRGQVIASGQHGRRGDLVAHEKRTFRDCVGRASQRLHGLCAQFSPERVARNDVRVSSKARLGQTFLLRNRFAAHTSVSRLPMSAKRRLVAASAPA